MTTPTAPDSAPTWLEELAAAERNATAAPWTVQANEQIAHGCRCLSCWEPVLGEWLVRADNDHEAERDARLIAALRNAAPRLLAIARAAAEFAKVPARECVFHGYECECCAEDNTWGHPSWNALLAALAGGGE